MMDIKRRVFAGLAVLSLPALLVSMNLAQAAPAQDFATPAFRTVWERTDLPVANHSVTRTWFWGPAPNSPGLIETDQDAPDSRRLVQYFDKSRMEVNNPAANPNSPFYVTNGLLTVELISGKMQVGNATYVTRYPACIPATGDPGDTNAPTYSALQHVSNTTLGDHPATDHMGQVVTATINHNGDVGTDPAKRSFTGTAVAYYDTVTKHNIPGVFWQFLNQQGPVYVNGALHTEALSDPWYYASGRPISEAYWTRATIRGHVTDVMIQMYERRALTYVPTNVPGFQVEMANIGQHYYDWRYRGFGRCGGGAEPTVEPTLAPTETPGAGRTAVATGTGTAVATGTPVGTGTPAATGTAMATGTVVGTETAVATGTVVGTGTPAATGTAVGTGTPAATGTAAATDTASPSVTTSPAPTKTLAPVPTVTP